MPNPHAQHNEQSKANFDHVYDLPDPRGYFKALAPWTTWHPSTAGGSSRPCYKNFGP